MGPPGDRGGAVPEGILRGSYEALARGDAGPLLGMLPPEFEWTEPEIEGYPLSGVHRGASGVARGFLAPLAELLDGLTFDLHEVVSAWEREVVTGAMRGRPAGSTVAWELPFAHVWELKSGVPVRATGYFDRSRLTLAGTRRQLAELADDLLEQAAEIRLQWSRLGDALRAAGVEAAESGGSESPGDSFASREDLVRGPESARLVAVDMAHEGRSRDEVETYLRDDLEIEDTGAILDEVFDESGAPQPDLPVEEASGAARLSRLFARRS
jgi:ketosteroid isomerase-like protein